MITRLRSTPSSSKMRCCSSPRRSPAWVCVEIGTPVRLCAWATARSTRSTPGVMPGSSVAHLRIPALTPVSAMPCSMSRTNMSVMISGPSSIPPGPR